MKKNGFTLIELMVVIVIIGILAAIAIPKLFGITAKAKASEVGPAAGTWIKLKISHHVETGESKGDAIAIGYIPPGSAAKSNTSTTANFEYFIEEERFNSGNHKTLGDCQANQGLWRVTAQAATSFIATVSGSGSSCEALTPQFSYIK